jgi:hypothetical protein
LALLARGEEPLPAEASRAAPTDGARDLTNKDFFWDL